MYSHNDAIKYIKKVDIYPFGNSRSQVALAKTAINKKVRIA